jgi:hypothetical protein
MPYRYRRVHSKRAQDELRGIVIGKKANEEQQPTVASPR